MGTGPYALAVIALVGAIGCAPAIGDSCNDSTDCSVDGERICDLAQPDGYCTVEGCDPDSCPGGARCVEWRFDPARTAETFCMKKCSGNGGCRTNDGYACVYADDERLRDPESGEPIARILDLEGRDKRFCAAVDSQ